MRTINNDSDLRSALSGLDLVQQRVLAARFVDSVKVLSDDNRVQTAIDAAANPETGEDELYAAFKSAKSAALEAHARCGADGEWTDQVGYFVARAAEAAVAPQVRTSGKGPAWQAAMSSRMARTCLATESDEDAHDKESHAQYLIMNNYLNS